MHIRDVLSTCNNGRHNYGSVRGEYRLCTDLRARRHPVACLVHEPEELSPRSSCVRPNDSPPVRVTRVPCTSKSANRNAPRVFKNPIVTCSECRALINAWSVRGPCLFGTSSLELSKKAHVTRADLIEQVSPPNLNLQRMVCALTNTKQRSI